MGDKWGLGISHMIKTEEGKRRGSTTKRARRTGNPSGEKASARQGNAAKLPASTTKVNIKANTLIRTKSFTVVVVVAVGHHIQQILQSCLW